MMEAQWSLPCRGSPGDFKDAGRRIDAYEMVNTLL